MHGATDATSAGPVPPAAPGLPPSLTRRICRLCYEQSKRAFCDAAYQLSLHQAATAGVSRWEVGWKDGAGGVRCW